jgi:hypothetical protein
MNFLDFLQLSKKVSTTIPTLNKMKKLSITKSLTKIPESRNELYFTILRQCFKGINNDKIQERKKQYVSTMIMSTGQQIADFEGAIINVPDGNKWYGFSIEDIIGLFHGNLSMSITNETYIDNVPLVTLDESFRLPSNPFDNKPFTMEQLKEIVSQLIYYKAEIEYPEVQLFLENFDQIINDSNQSFDSKIYLKKFFQNHGLTFYEDVLVRGPNIYNNSRWIPVKKISNKAWWLKFI